MKHLALAAAVVTAASPSMAAKVAYYGGPVIENPKVYVVWWGPSSKLSPLVTAAQGGITDLFAGLVDSPYVDWLNEYDTDITVQGGAHAGSAGTGQHIGRGNLAGVWELDVPAGNVTDAQVQSTLLGAIATGALPPGDPNAIYALLFPPGVQVDDSCARGGFEGYHASTADSVDGVPYIVLVDCSFTSFGQFGLIASHELVESITDRVPTAGDVPDFPQAWNDSQAFETADLCDRFGAAPVSTPLGPFPVEPIWDEVSGGCTLFHAFPQDYNVSLDPAVADLRAGQTVSITVRTGTTNGSAQPLSLSVAAPAGISVSLDRSTVNSGETATLTLVAGADVAVARGAQAIVGAQGTTGSRPQRHTAALLLQPPEFSLFVGATAGDLESNGTTTVPIRITPLHGDPGPLDLTVSSLPKNVTGDFSAISNGAATLTLHAHGAVPAAAAKFFVHAQGATASHTAAGLVAVVPASGGCASTGDAGALVLLALVALRRRR